MANEAKQAQTCDEIDYTDPIRKEKMRLQVESLKEAIADYERGKCGARGAMVSLAFAAAIAIVGWIAGS